MPIPGRKSCFRAGFRPDSNRENFKIGLPGGRRADVDAFMAGLRPGRGDMLCFANHSGVGSSDTAQCGEAASVPEVVEAKVVADAMCGEYGSYLPIPPDGLCLFHCAVAAQNVAEYRSQPREETGFAKDVVISSHTRLLHLEMRKARLQHCRSTSNNKCV
jgi:hypothetical protein